LQTSEPAKALSVKEDWPFLPALVAVASMLFLYGYKSFWLPADEGTYAHCVQRILEGQLPHRDFLLLHPGLNLWANVWALKLCGMTLSALRWPAIVLAILQTPMVYLLLRPLGPWVAAVGVVWNGALGLPAVPSPSAGLFATFFALAALWSIAQERPWGSRSRLMALGFALGLAFCSRQITAVFLGCGLISWMLAHPAIEERKGQAVLGRALLLCSAVMISWYVFGRSNVFGAVCFALPPVLLAWQAFWRGRPSHDVAMRIVTWVGTGFLLSFLPLVAYNAWQGILTAWFTDVFVRSTSFLSLGFTSMFRLSDILRAIALAAPLIRSPVALVQMATWLFLLFVSLLVGLFCFARRQKNLEVPAYVFCGPFLALGALQIEIEIYLIWAVPVAVLGGLYVLREVTPGPKAFPAAGLLLLLGFFNSTVGKPVWLRDQKDFVLTPLGQRPPLVYLGGRADLFVPASNADFYGRSLDLIEREVGPDEAIFSFPYHPEWYFLASRKNPTPYTLPGMAVVSPETLASCQRALQQEQPRLILYNYQDKYNTPFTRQLRSLLEPDYEIIHQEQGYEFLLRKEPTLVKPRP
jgi:hypothetical protein